MAEENSRRLQIPAKFLQSDLFENVEGKFHMIVSNPPYIPGGEIDSLMEEVSVHDPRLALDGGADGLDFYRRLLADGWDYLKPGGAMLLEIGADQGEWAQAHMKSGVSGRCRLSGICRGLTGLFWDISDILL